MPQELLFKIFHVVDLILIVVKLLLIYNISFHPKLRIIDCNFELIL